MRITCPLCGPRDRREFYYYGSDDYLDRPAPDAPPQAWDDYLHLRDNPAGITRDLWYHDLGCSAWLVVTRNTVTHEISGVELVAGRKDAATAGTTTATKTKTATKTATKTKTKGASA